MGHSGHKDFAQLRKTTWAALVGDMPGSVKALELAGQSLAPSTLKTYGWAFQKFLKYCNSQKKVWTEVATSAGGMACFIGFLMDSKPPYKPVSIPSMLSAIYKVVVDSGLKKPEHALLLNIGQALKKAAAKEANNRAAFKSTTIAAIMAVCDSLRKRRMTRSHSASDLRQKIRAQIQSGLAVTLGFVLMLRRSTVQAMQRRDLRFGSDGELQVHLRFEKGKQKGRTLLVRGPVAEWVGNLINFLPENQSAYLFDDFKELYGSDVQQMLTCWLTQLEVQPPIGMIWAWHSLRKGGATAAYHIGVQDIKLLNYGGWKTRESLTKSYIDFTHVGVPEDRLLLGFLRSDG